MNDQRSLTEQLRDLVTLANKAGLYDAADFVRTRLEECDRKQAAYKNRKGDRVEKLIDLWNAINTYAKTCGGDTSAKTVSTAREEAVAKIDKLLRGE